jgi:hypothetical protein
MRANRASLGLHEDALRSERLLENLGAANDVLDITPELAAFLAFGCRHLCQRARLAQFSEIAVRLPLLQRPYQLIARFCVSALHSLVHGLKFPGEPPAGLLSPLRLFCFTEFSGVCAESGACKRCSTRGMVAMPESKVVYKRRIRRKRIRIQLS